MANTVWSIDGPYCVLSAIESNSFLKELAIDWDDAVLKAHEQYDSEEKGHGGIKLWQTIQGEKASQLPNTLSNIEYDRIYGYCATLLDTAGYAIDGGKLRFE